MNPLLHMTVLEACEWSYGMPQSAPVCSSQDHTARCSLHARRSSGLRLLRWPSSRRSSLLLSPQTAQEQLPLGFSSCSPRDSHHGFPAQGHQGPPGGYIRHPSSPPFPLCSMGQQRSGQLTAAPWARRAWRCPSPRSPLLHPQPPASFPPWSRPCRLPLSKVTGLGSHTAPVAGSDVSLTLWP